MTGRQTSESNDEGIIHWKWASPMSKHFNWNLENKDEKHARETSMSKDSWEFMYMMCSGIS